VQMMLAIRLSVGRAMDLAKQAARHTSASEASINSPRQRPSTPASGGEPSASAHAAASASSDENAHPLSREMFDDIWKTRIPGSRKGRETSIVFKDYAPLVFRRIRSLFGISDRDYMLSLGPEQILGELLLGTVGSLAELFSEGKSGSFFYFSNDGRYLIKTIPHRELLSLTRLLPKYVKHVETQPFTLLPRFMGAHRIQMPGAGGRKVHFIVMTNVFSSPRLIHERYDLKGSTHGRSAGAENLRNCPDLVRKDLDLRQPFHLQEGRREAILQQIASDLAFLRDVYTMDYSMLCGIHYPRREWGNDDALPQAASAGGAHIGAAMASSASTEEVSVVIADASGDADGIAMPALPSQLSTMSDASLDDPSGGPQPDGEAVQPKGEASPGKPAETIRSVTDDHLHFPAPGGESSPAPSPPASSGGRKVPAEARPSTRPRVAARDSRFASAPREAPPWVDYVDRGICARETAGGTEEPVVYFIGIIDILTEWTCAKSLENIYRTLCHPTKPNAHSCVPPLRYAARFEKALRNWID